MGSFSVIGLGLEQVGKAVWEYPPFRVRLVYDSTATGETNSSSFVTLRTYSITLPKPLSSFKIRLRATRRNRNTDTAVWRTTYYRMVVTSGTVSYIFDLGSVTAGVNSTVDSPVDVDVGVDFPNPVSSLTIDLQARAEASTSYASYQPPIVVEAGYLFSTRIKIRDGAIVPAEIVEEELEAKIDTILSLLSSIKSDMDKLKERLGVK